MFVIFANFAFISSTFFSKSFRSYLAIIPGMASFVFVDFFFMHWTTRSIFLVVSTSFVKSFVPPWKMIRSGFLRKIGFFQVWRQKVPTSSLFRRSGH